MTYKTIMACSRSVLSLIYALSVLVTLGPAYCKVSNASQGTQAKDSAPNVYNTYNTFCTGLSKKIEVLLHEVKNELSEMRDEIRSLKENNTTSQGNILSSRWKSPFEFTMESRVLNHLGKGKLVRIIRRFEKSGVKLQCLRWMDVIGLARIIGDFEKPRGREIGILLYNYTPRKYIQRLVHLWHQIQNGQPKFYQRNSICILFLGYRNCAELYKAGQRKSGVYTINPDNAGAFDVYCDQTTAGGGWTVLQKRLDGSVDFYRGWDDYKRGFGNLNGEFWLGLDKIHRLTILRSRLRVDLEDTNGKTAYAEYDFFGVSSERSKYKLSLGTYSGEYKC